MTGCCDMCGEVREVIARFLRTSPDGDVMKVLSCRECIVGIEEAITRLMDKKGEKARALAMKAGRMGGEPK